MLLPCVVVVPLSESLPVSVLLAHAGEFHIGDLLIAAPLLVLIVIGLVWFVRAAATDAGDATEDEPPEEESATAVPQAKPRGPTAGADG